MSTQRTFRPRSVKAFTARVPGSRSFRVLDALSWYLSLILTHSVIKLDFKNIFDQNLEGARACCAPLWIRHCILLLANFCYHKDFLYFSSSVSMYSCTIHNIYWLWFSRLVYMNTCISVFSLSHSNLVVNSLMSLFHIVYCFSFDFVNMYLVVENTFFSWEHFVFVSVIK